jgi:signal transduction histidine kinase
MRVISRNFAWHGGCNHRCGMTPLTALSKGEYAHSVELALIRHELSQPLTFLMTSLSLLRLKIERDLQSCEGAASLVTSLGAAHESASHIGDMVRRIGAAGSDDVGPVDLADVIEKTLLIAEDSVGRHANLVREIECRAVVNANATRMRQVLLNLLTNAVFAVRDTHGGRGNIVVRLVREGKSDVALEVIDDGVGIRESEKAMVGELHFTTRPERGRGFGLALCRSIVESYGGSFSIDSECSRGTMARVVMPLIEPDSSGEKRS